MRFFKLLIFLLSLLNITLLHGQSSQKKERFVGINGGAIIPIDYFGAGPLDINHDHTSITLSSKFGYQFGMIMRTNYNDRLSFETGICFTRRNFELKGSSFSQGINKDTSDFGYINYSLPFKGGVFIQLGENFYMNTFIGANLDFYASAVASQGHQYNIDHYSERARWINASLTADLGVEWRGDEKGIFYFGAGVNIPISAIAVTRLKYYYTNTDYDNYDPIFLRGNYLAIKLKYFFPLSLEKTPDKN